MNQNIQTSIANTIKDDGPHNLVVHRMPTNGIDMDIYRTPLRRNGMQDQYRTEVISPVNNENFVNRRVSEYDDEDVMPQDHSRGLMEPRTLELSEARLDDKRIVKPAPLQARLVSLVDTDMKDTVKRFFVIPQNSLEKKIVLLKNEPTDAVQVSW